MKYKMKSGDTTFIGIANADTYMSFVDVDWSLNQLLKHFGEETKNANIMVFQMSVNGIEHSWKVKVTVNQENKVKGSYRKAQGYIRVTNKELYLVDYDCLTMAAQFNHRKVPDQNCSNYRISIQNGIYQVNVYQFYDVDSNSRTGSRLKDMLIEFHEVKDISSSMDTVYWCNF